MGNKIQIRRGVVADLPALDTGEPGLCTDTGQVYIGNGGSNVLLGGTGVTHVAITLDTNADSLLSLTGQQVGLDAQAANLVLAGPTSGSPAAPTFRALVLADLPQLTNGQLYIGVTGSAPVAATLTGTANQIIVTNGVGTITLSAPQDLHTAAVPQFAGLTTAYVKPAADSETGVQIRRADGTTAVVNVDTTNQRVGIGTTGPGNKLGVADAISVGSSYAALTGTNASNGMIIEGNVGIGTTAPGNKLHVSNSVLDTTPIVKFDNSYDSAGAISSLALGLSGPSTFGGDYFYLTSIGNANNDVDFRIEQKFSYESTPRAFLTIKSSGNVGIGTTGPVTLIHGVKTDAVTNTITNILTFDHASSSAPAAGFGGGINLQLKSSTTAAQNAARLAWLWQTATHASRAADVVMYASDYAAEREIWRGRATGSAAAIGFLGATPSPRLSHIADPSGGSTVDAEARAAIGSILTALETFGLVATS